MTHGEVFTEEKCCEFYDFMTHGDINAVILRILVFIGIDDAW